jgi:hypothetical protein
VDQKCSDIIHCRLDSSICLPGRGWFDSPSFSGYENNIVIRDGVAHSCWISDSASIKETCILWVLGYVNTRWRGKTPGRPSWPALACICVDVLNPSNTLSSPTSQDLGKNLAAKNVSSILLPASQFLKPMANKKNLVVALPVFSHDLRCRKRNSC